jgi:signal peptidase II
VYIYYLIAVVIVAIDHWTKWLVVKNMELGERIVLIDPTFALLSHRNRGAAWGMLEGQMWLFTIVTIIVVIGILYYFHKEAKSKPLFQISLMVLLGGTLGNFIDRIFRGEVVDFADVLIPVINYDFPIFNIADAALTIGVVMLIIVLFLEEKAEKAAKKKGE